MIIQGANDPRVPASEAEQMYQALKARGLDVELHMYQDEGHGIVKLTNQLDLYPKMVQFLDRVLLQ
jgi:dipeptidyl aminopeptidase/acylaminoacyl peptidase